MKRKNSWQILLVTLVFLACFPTYTHAASINPGETKTRNIVSSGQMDPCSFSANVGDTVTILMGVSTGSLDPQVELHAPDGSVVATAWGYDSGYTFSSWGGNLTGSTSPASISMNTNKNVTANFSAGCGPTNVTGLISSDANWTLACSPYIVTGNVLVASGVTLTIEPGVVIKFNSGKSLQIDGALIARGTKGSQITFTSNLTTPAPGDWGYILFSDSSTDATYDGSGNYTGGSILEYAVVEYAGGVSVSNNGAIRMDNAHPFINYCTIRDNNASGIHAWNLSGTLKIINSNISNNNTSGDGGGIYINGGTVTISDNIISDNTASGTGGGIYSIGFWGETVTICNNTIIKNTALSNGAGIYIAVWYNTAAIYNNTIINNYSSGSGGGINISEWDGIVTIHNNILKNNTALGIGGGIFVWHATITISNNSISNNTASDGGGMYISQWNTATINNNSISDNTASGTGGGIYVYVTYQYGSATIFNNSIIRNSAQNSVAVYYFSTDNKDFKYNTIVENKNIGTSPTYTVCISGLPLFNFNNIFNNSATYELWNNNAQGSANVNAENNWWGTSIESEIQAKIYDWFDDSSKGIVDYSPRSTTIRTDAPISPPTGFTATMGADSITLNWSANPEADVAGYKVYYGTTSGFPYGNVVDVGKVTNYTITGLTPETYYVTVTAYDTSYNPANDDPNSIVNENQTNGNESGMRWNNV